MLCFQLELYACAQSSLFSETKSWAETKAYGKLLFTWLSLVMSMMVSFCAVLLSHEGDVDEIWGLIESVSESFPIYSHFPVSL